MTEQRSILCDGPGCDTHGPAEYRGANAGDAWIRVTLTILNWGNATQSGDFCSEVCAKKWIDKEGLPTAISGATPERTPR